MKRILALLLTFSLLPHAVCSAANSPDISVDVPSAILIEKSSGTILFEKDAYVRRPPASVTKLMTMLLVAEAIASGSAGIDDTVTASANAAGMGGSQIWLEEGESMSLGEMLKCVTVVSANDCCVALAEHLAGSEETFVRRMNERAAQLGLENTNFVCCSGLSDSPDHYSCAHDLAVIARELLKYEFIKDYTTIWMDTIRAGEFTLSNTNKLIYYYQGATGLKTGFTSRAMHCLAASAQRDGVEYIAVILGAETSAKRFDSAKILLDYAFANYKLVAPESLTVLPPVRVNSGTADCAGVRTEAGQGIVIRKSCSELRCETVLPEALEAPVEEGSRVGELLVYDGDVLLAKLPIVAVESIERLELWDIFFRLICSLL